MLVDVPMSVHVPPRMEANATGSSSFEGLTRSFRAIPITGDMNIAVTVVLFMNAEVNQIGRAHV